MPSASGRRNRTVSTRENTTARHFRDLQKRMTKLHTHNYGVLAHVFLFAEELLVTGSGNKVAWIVSDDLQADLGKMVWAAVSELADVPLLDSWSTEVLEMLRQTILFADVRARHGNG